jgi:hypothetical protein
VDGRCPAARILRIAREVSAAVLLHIVLLCHCAVVMLCCCATADSVALQLCCCATALLCCCATAYSVALLLCCDVVLLCRRAVLLSVLFCACWYLRARSGGRGLLVLWFVFLCNCWHFEGAELSEG